MKILAADKDKNGSEQRMSGIRFGQNKKQRSKNQRTCVIFIALRKTEIISSFEC